jgi:ABC-type dipeptide/oligopeptide/nickel transport system permease component
VAGSTATPVGLANWRAAGVIEIVFNRPGLSKLLVDAILQRDYPLSQALITVLLVGVILINLTTDILYGLVDPRIRANRA